MPSGRHHWRRRQRRRWGGQPVREVTAAGQAPLGRTQLRSLMVHVKCEWLSIITKEKIEAFYTVCLGLPFSGIEPWPFLGTSSSFVIHSDVMTRSLHGVTKGWSRSFYLNVVNRHPGEWKWHFQSFLTHLQRHSVHWICKSSPYSFWFSLNTHLSRTTFLM